VTSTDPIADTILALGLGFTIYVGLRNGHKADKAAGKLEEVHGLVNAQLTDAIDRKDVAEARTRVLEGEHKEVQP
jgi:small nuclear ribonucleoprotein (snRNP)-like protein